MRLIIARTVFGGRSFNSRVSRAGTGPPPYGRGTRNGSKRSDPMDVTIVDGDVPYPPNSGKRLRSLNLVLPLAGRHRVSYIARCASAQEGQVAAQFLRDKGIEPIMVEAPLPAKSGAAFYGRLAGNLMSALPYSVKSHRIDAMRAAVVAHAARRKVDVWQVEWFGYLYCVEGLGATTVLSAHNIEALIWQRYAETGANTLRRAYAREQWRKMLAFERASFGSATRIVAVSEPDVECGRNLYGNLPFACIDNGVDIAYFRDQEASMASRQILFLGALDWRPNQDAVAILLDEIFPAVKARMPDATLAIVGRHPPARLIDRAQAMDGVTLYADVPDVRPYMAASAMMAVPLRIGGGSRLKIIEAIAARLPVVTTAIGAEGLNLAPGRDFDLADTPAEMAAAIMARLAQPSPVSQATWSSVAAQYDWPVLAERFERIWLEAAGARLAQSV